MHLTEILKSKGVSPPGITPEGAAWLAKTLHPADNVPPWTGIPTGSGLPSVVMEYEALLRIAPNAAAVGTYYGYCNLLPHPLQPFSAVTTDSVGDLTWGLRNPTMYSSGTSFNTMVGNLMNLAGAYRMTHVSATCELDAPALSNQGSVTAAQYPLIYYEFNPSFVLAAGADAGKLALGVHVRHMANAVNELDREALAAKPYSYSGLAKDGVYQVLKLDPDAEWVRMRDLCMHTAQGAPTPSSTGVILPLAGGGVGTNEVFPWYGGNYPAADRFISASVNPATATFGLTGSINPKMSQPNFGRIAFWNLAVTAGITVRVRWGVEFLVHPTSALAPSTRACAPRDEVALAAYSRIVDELPDAFPGCYNSWDDLGKMLRIVWNKISPGVGLAAKGMGGPFGLAATGVQALGDLIARTTVKDRQRDREQRPDINVPPPKDFPAKKKAKSQKPKPRLTPEEQKALAAIKAACRMGITLPGMKA